METTTLTAKDARRFGLIALAVGIFDMVFALSGTVTLLLFWAAPLLITFFVEKRRYTSLGLVLERGRSNHMCCIP